jgi:GNAT superfamily N-acetyltransferase
MPLEVHPITKTDDLLEWCHIHYEAFVGTSVGVLWTGKPSVESFQKMAEYRAKLFQDPSAHLFKCIDTDLNNKMIAVAYWSVQKEERTPEEVEKGLQLRPPFPEQNRPATIEFMDGIFKSRREWGTKPHVMLESLITLPEHHRRGAGSLLLKWGVGEADNLRIIAYLEGSKAGVPLYTKFGFEPIKTIEFDAIKYGGKEKDVHVVCLISPFHCSRLT